MTSGKLSPQPRVQRFLRQLVRRGQVPHAMLFCGMNGVGKGELAKEFSKLLNCREPRDLDPCGICGSCRKIENGTHPDVLRVQAETSVIKIEQVREVRHRLRFRPFEARLRAIILDGAHNLKDEAGNALLKILEDPPPHNLFLLLAPESQMVLPTLVSRCCRVQFPPLEDRYVAQYLVETYGMPEDRARELAGLSQGSLDRARSLAEENQLERQKEVIRKIYSLANLSMIDFFDVTADWVQKTQDLEQDFESIKLWLREILLATAGRDSNTGFDRAENIRALAGSISRERILELYDTMELATQHLRQNANKLLTLEGVCLAVKRGLYGQSGWNSLS